MKKVVVIESGYTVEVTSWENDGDHNNTLQETYDTKEKAVAIAKFLKNCIKPISNNNDDHEEEVVEYLEKHGEALGISTYDEAQDLVHDLLGGSEWYTFRVPESISITYSPVDISLEVIKF